MRSEEWINRVVAILVENRYLSLGTSDRRGPWVAPLAYVINGLPFELVFYSSTESRHAIAINENKNVAFSIFNSTLGSDEADGVQGDGVVREVSEHELPLLVPLYFERSFADIQIRKNWERPWKEFRGNNPLRFYAIKPLHIYLPFLTDERTDSRIEVDLDPEFMRRLREGVDNA